MNAVEQKRALIKDPLDTDKIERSVKTKTLGSRVIVFNQTASTNDIAREYASNINNNGIVILAEHQTAGRGRLGRSWHEQKGSSILMSVLLTRTPLNPQIITLAAAVACAEAIKKIAPNLSPSIKWPNDILINNRKIAGILIESHKTNCYIIGVGINCRQNPSSFNRDDFHTEPTSLDIETKNFIDRNDLIPILIDNLELALNTAQTNSSFIIEKWKQLSTLIGKHIKIKYNDKIFSGCCIGVDPLKGMILQLTAGSVKFFQAPHCTIVKQVD